MAGHSKFKNIMHRKGAQDKKRAKIFARLGREITVAAKLGGGDPDANPRLRLAIQAARKENMPKDNIQRAVDKGDSSDANDNYEEIRYEGYGPGGIAFIVECLTDNRNRTAASVRSIFTKGGGSLGESGSVSFQFDKVGLITYKAEIGDEDTVMEAALEAGASDVEFDGESHTIIAAMEDFIDVRLALDEQFGAAEEAELTWKPQNTIEVADKDKAESIMRLVANLDDDDDVQTVSGNFDIEASILESLDV